MRQYKMTFKTDLPTLLTVTFFCCLGIWQLCDIGLSALNNWCETQRTEATGTESSYFPPAELATIRIAAIRNGIQPGTENWYILLAIRKAENGKPGLEFGIMNPKANDLDSQAGWAAASILGARGRWDSKGDFVDAMGARYCPPDDHPLNKHWAGNVRAWVEKLGGGR